MKIFQIKRHADLPFTEQYVLWGLRLWALGNDTGSNMASKIHEGFLRGGAPHRGPEPNSYYEYDC